MKRKLRLSTLLWGAFVLALAIWAYYMLVVVGASKNAVFIKLAACALLCLFSVLVSRMVLRLRMSKVSDLLEEHEYAAASENLDWLIKNETMEPEAFLGRCFIAALFEDGGKITELTTAYPEMFTENDSYILNLLSAVLLMLAGKFPEGNMRAGAVLPNADSKLASPFYSDMPMELNAVISALNMINEKKFRELRSFLSRRKKIEFNQVYNDVLVLLWDYIECVSAEEAGSDKRAREIAAEAVQLCRGVALARLFDRWWRK